MEIKFIDLFAGIGGFRYGLENANISSQRKFNCVYTNEWDKYAAEVYKKHYGECDTRDIRTIDSSEIPDHDLLCGGFPCQAFSIAGKRAGFNDTRGTLFFEIARILRDKKPRYLLLENVKGLLSHDSGKTFSTILGVLTDLGYSVEWQVLNSKNFGVPQNRERVFIIGHLGNKCRRKVFPIGSSTGPYLKEITSGVSDAQRIYTTQLAKSQKAPGGGLGAKTGLYAIPVLTPDRPEKRQNGSGQPVIYVPEATRKGYAEATVGDAVNLTAINSKTRRGRVGNGVANTLEPSQQQYTVAQDKHGIYNGTRIRRFTPKECERLQGFPDDWTKYGVDNDLISDNQRYKMCGNAVTTNVITAIGERIINQTPYC